MAVHPGRIFARTIVATVIIGVGLVHGQTATIGGNIYGGANDGAGRILAPNALTPPILDARVMVQNQHAGGAFVTYGTMTGPNTWTATVPAPGDYVVMFSAPGHDCTSREFTVTAGGETQTRDAYLPPLPLPLANLLVYTFYENEINGEPDDGEDVHLNGVTVKVWDEAGNLLATGITGTQPANQLPLGGEMTGSDGLYYFTGLPPGEVRVTSDPSTAYLYDVNGPTPLPVVNPVNRSPLDFDATTEFYLLSSEEGGQAFEVVLYPGDPGTEAGAYLVWHGFVEKLGQITADNVKNRFGARGTIAGAGQIIGTLADADQAWVLELPDPNEPAEAPEALVPPLHPGVTANTIIPDGLVVLHTDTETSMPHPLATVEADPVTGEFIFENVPPGRYKMFCSDIPIDYVYVQQEVMVQANQSTWVPNPAFAAETPGIMVPRFYARAHGVVRDNTTGQPIEGAEVHIRLPDGSVWKTAFTDATGAYLFDDLPEVEVLAFADVKLPAGFRGAVVTDTFYPDAVWLNPNCNPVTTASCTALGAAHAVAHNAMNRYIQWYTANYQADFLLEPIPAATGDIAGFVYYDHLATGTWVGDGLYDQEEDRTLPGVTVELWDAAGTTLLDTTTTGAVDEAALRAQGWKEPFTIPLDEWGGVFVGPMPGFYEFRDLAPGDYTVKVLPPAGYSPSPAGSDVVTLTVNAAARADHHFGVNTQAPLSAEIEGGVFDDVFIDPRPLSLMFMEKAGVDGAPVGAYDHLGYFLGAGYMGIPMCYEGADVGPDPLTQCPPSEPLGQKPELERRFAPTTLLYLGNDPSLPGFNAEYLPLVMPYDMDQGQHKFEADWSLIPVAFGQGPTQMVAPPLPGPLAANPPPPPPAPVIQNVTPVGSYMITGTHFGAERGFSTVTLSGRELAVLSWSDTQIHVSDPTDPISGPMMVTTHAGPSNAVHVELTYTPDRAAYMAERSVFVDASNTGARDGSRAHPWTSMGEALNHLPAARPRYVFVAPGYYNERVQIKESDIHFIGAGPHETTVDGLGSMQLSMENQGIVGRGPVFFIGRGGQFGGVENILISGLTITGGSVDDDIGCGIFGDAGNRNLDINTCIIDHNGGYYGGAIWLQKTNHDVRIWSNTISNNGCAGGYSGGISVNDEPEYGPHHGEPEHIVDDEIPGCPPGTYEIFNNHLFRNFSPDYGGAISLYEVKDHLIVAGNLIEDNHADDHGGGVFFEDSGPIDLYGNTILRNSNYDDGGAVSFEDVTDNNALVRVHHNVIALNWADDHGENHVRGGGIAFDDTFYAEIYDNTIVSNVAAGSKDPVGGAIDSERHGHEYNGTEPLGRDFAPGFSDVKIYNNIIWDNLRLKYDQKQHSDEEDLDWRFGENHVWSPDNFHVDDPAVQSESETYRNSEAFSVVENNVISNGEYADRLGNLSADPQFVEADNLDWRLAPGSPAAGKGAYANGGGRPEPVGTVSPLAASETMCNATCYFINEVTVGTNGLDVTVRGTFGAVGEFDAAVDGVRLSIIDGSGHTADCWIPPGSFVAEGDPDAGVYRYVGPVPGKNAMVDALFHNCGFTIRTSRAPNISRPIGTKMKVSLSVGEMIGRDAIFLEPVNGQMHFRREPQFDCCPIQPIAFDHAEHLEEDEANLTCVDCHTDPTTRLFSGIPGKSKCFTCHTGQDDTVAVIRRGDVDGDGDVDRCDLMDILRARNQPATGTEDRRDLDGDGLITVMDARMEVGLCDVARCPSCTDSGHEHGGSDEGGHDEIGGLVLLAELEPYMNNDLELPWTQMAIIRPAASFSHRRHVDDGRIDCLVCHAGQPSLERPPRVIYRVMTMRECRTCHQDHGASIDCQTCHAYSFGPGYIAGE